MPTLKNNLWRFTLLLAFLFWQGGFLFYSTVVIEVAQDVLGSHREAGFITQRVTHWLNLAAALALTLLLIHALIQRRPRLYWASWSTLALTLIALVALHPSLDAHMRPDIHALTDRTTFYTLHRLYLALTTLQWAAAMVMLWCLVTEENPTSQSDPPP